MYIDITPLEVKKFEKENNISLFELLQPSFHNLVLLEKLLKRLPENEALKSALGVLAERDMIPYFSEVLDELESLGYISFDPDADEKIPSKTFGELWEESFADAYRLGLSKDDYWTLMPKQVVDISLALVEDRKAQMQGEVNMQLYLARLMALAMNNPRKLPKKPPNLFEEETEGQRLRREILQGASRQGGYKGSEEEEL